MALGEAGVVVLLFRVDAGATLGRVLVHRHHIVRTEVERPDDVEGHLAVETEPLEADGRDLVAVLVEGTNLSLNHIGITLGREGRLTVFTEEGVMVCGRSEKGGREGGDCMLSKPCYLSVDRTDAEVKRRLGPRPDNRSTPHRLLKMPRTQKPTTKSRHDPLHVDIAADDLYSKYGNLSKPGRRKKSRHGDEEQAGTEVRLSIPVQQYSYPHRSDYLRSEDVEAHL